MEVIYLGQSKINNKLSLCIGQFDAIHLGHQKLIFKTIEYAKKNNLKSGIITFNKNPLEVINNTKIKNILSEKERIEKCNNLGLDYYIVIDFTESLMRKSADDFNKYLSDFLNIEAFFCGLDFKYGFKGAGNYIHLKKSFNNVFVLDFVEYLEEKISSSRIKNTMLNGNIEEVNKMLGYNYFLISKIIKGKSIGRSIGFKTANLEVNDELCYVKNGIYNVWVFIDEKKYHGLLNIGTNPTIDESKNIKIEVHILDFDQEIYGKEIKVEFLEYIRSEQKFNSLTELKNQIFKDVEYVLQRKF